MPQPQQPVHIFIAYSRNDRKFLESFCKHLKPLERNGKIKIWTDSNIEPGHIWDDAIKKALQGADIIVLLVSADSIASDYFYGQEVAISLARHERGEARVVPLILRSCAWKETPISKIQALPKDGKPIVNWPIEDDGWDNAVNAISQIVNEIRLQYQAKEDQQRAELHEKLQRARLKKEADKRDQARWESKEKWRAFFFPVRKQLYAIFFNERALGIFLGLLLTGLIWKSDFFGLFNPKVAQRENLRNTAADSLAKEPASPIPKAQSVKDDHSENQDPAPSEQKGDNKKIEKGTDQVNAPVTAPAPDPNANRNKTKDNIGGAFGKPLGDGSQPGNSGVPAGTRDNPFGKNAGDGGGSGGGSGTGTGPYISGGLSGRKIKYRPKMVDDSKKTGKVAVEICVDGSGNVVSGTYKMSGSTTNDSELRAKAISWGKQFRFESSSVSKECGTITFNFIIK